MNKVQMFIGFMIVMVIGMFALVYYQSLQLKSIQKENKRNWGFLDEQRFKNNFEADDFQELSSKIQKMIQQNINAPRGQDAVPKLIISLVEKAKLTDFLKSVVPSDPEVLSEKVQNNRFSYEFRRIDVGKIMKLLVELEHSKKGLVVTKLHLNRVNAQQQAESVNFDVQWYSPNVQKNKETN